MEAAVNNVGVKFDDLTKKDLRERIRIARIGSDEKFKEECDKDISIVQGAYGDNVKEMYGYAQKDLPKSKKIMHTIAAVAIGLTVTGFVTTAVAMNMQPFSVNNRTVAAAGLSTMGVGIVAGLPVGVAFKTKVEDDKKILDTLDKWGAYSTFVLDNSKK